MCLPCTPANLAFLCYFRGALEHYQLPAQAPSCPPFLHTPLPGGVCSLPRQEIEGGTSVPQGRDTAHTHTHTCKHITPLPLPLHKISITTMHFHVSVSSFLKAYVDWNFIQKKKMPAHLCVCVCVCGGAHL